MMKALSNGQRLFALDLMQSANAISKCNQQMQSANAISKCYQQMLLAQDQIEIESLQ